MTLNLYLKQCVAWGIALQKRYRQESSLRICTSLFLLQVGSVLIGVFCIWSLLHSGPVWMVLIGSFLLVVLMGSFLIRIALQPFTETLQQQKRFVSNLSHEIRTPLSTILLGTEVALLSPETPPTIRKSFRSIHTEAERISEIINNRLTLSTLSQPETLSFTSIPIERIVTKVTRYYRELARERNILLKVYKDPCTVVGNEAALEQMLMNLLKNALIYTPKTKKNRGTVIVRTHTTPQGDALLSVSDTGIGMSREDLPHVLEPYYRSDTARTRMPYQKSGLGLTIVHEIVRIHHGKIHIRSSVGKGTTVQVYLPSSEFFESHPFSFLPSLGGILQKYFPIKELQKDNATSSIS